MSNGTKYWGTLYTIIEYIKEYRNILRYFQLAFYTNSL